MLGVLACLDGYMNIAMEQTEEFVDGQLKAKYGDAFIRGNNGILFIRRIVLFLCFSRYRDRQSRTSLPRRGGANSSHIICVALTSAIVFWRQRPFALGSSCGIYRSIWARPSALFECFQIYPVFGTRLPFFLLDRAGVDSSDSSRISNSLSRPFRRSVNVRGCSGLGERVSSRRACRRTHQM
jgi:hypothetical protein